MSTTFRLTAHLVEYVTTSLQVQYPMSWLISHPGASVAFAINDAQLCRNDLRAEIKRVGLLEIWGKELTRH